MAKIEVLASGVDYIRFTIDEKHDALDGLIDYFEEQQKAEEIEFGEIEYFEFQKFYGPMSRHFYYGVHGELYIFQVSSTPAHALVEWLRQFQYIVQATRIDFHATTQCPKKLGAFAFDLRDEVRAVEAKKGTKRTCKITIVDDPGKGQSCSMGNRKSGTLDRSYDKGLEQGGKIGKNIKRDESEISKKQAKKMWADVLKTDNLAQFALDVVAARYKKRGVKLPYEAKAREYQLPTVYEQSNDERITEWLVRCAASAFRKVKSERLRRAVAEAFGLGYKPLKTATKPVLTEESRATIQHFHEARMMRLERAGVGADEDE